MCTKSPNTGWGNSFYQQWRKVVSERGKGSKRQSANIYCAKCAEKLQIQWEQESLPSRSSGSVASEWVKGEGPWRTQISAKNNEAKVLRHTQDFPKD